MKPILFLASLLLIFGIGRAQVFEDFNDGDFYENPAWVGSDSLYIINDEKQLQLNAESAGNAWISVAYEKHEETEWRFWIKEKFSPSSKNFCDVYLYGDAGNTTTNNFSYILRFGESGSDDVIELLRINNGVTTSLCRGTDAFIASAFSTFVKVTYDESRIWNIYNRTNGIISTKIAIFAKITPSYTRYTNAATRECGSDEEKEEYNNKDNQEHSAHCGHPHHSVVDSRHCALLATRTAVCD